MLDGLLETKRSAEFFLETSRTARLIGKKVPEKRFAEAAVVKDRVLMKEKGKTTELIIEYWLRYNENQYSKRSSME